VSIMRRMIVGRTHGQVSRRQILFASQAKHSFAARKNCCIQVV
jgi:hypothetical protein